MASMVGINVKKKGGLASSMVGINVKKKGAWHQWLTSMVGNNVNKGRGTSMVVQIVGIGVINKVGLGSSGTK